MKNLFALLTIFFSLGFLSACGGSGGGGGSSAGADNSSSSQISGEDTAVAATQVELDATPTDMEPEVDYTPDPILMTEKAENTTGLYVKPDFNFDDFQSLQLQLSAYDMNGNPLSGHLIKLYALQSDIVEMDDDRLHASDLLFVGRLDSEGFLEKSIEIVGSIEKVLVKVMAVGIDNQVMLALDPENPVVVHRF